METFLRNLPIVYFCKEGELVWWYVGFKDIEDLRQHIAVCMQRNKCH